MIETRLQSSAVRRSNIFFDSRILTALPRPNKHKHRYNPLLAPDSDKNQQVGIRCVKLEGSMSLEQRSRAIDSFTHDPSVRVFLMSLKAGGVALNLTAASHVCLMDPWWNPAVEQ